MASQNDSANGKRATGARSVAVGFVAAALGSCSNKPPVPLPTTRQGAPIHPATAYASGGGSDLLRIGIIGCGNRGRGAARDCLETGRGVQIVALADAFPDAIEDTLRLFADRPKEQFDVPPDRRFVGFDAYQKLLACGVDLVIQTTPPAFRPLHLTAAAAAGKHVFAEKPAAVDPVGARLVLEAAVVFAQKRLGFVPGLERRHTPAYLATLQRIAAGDIGRVVCAQGYCLMGSTRGVIHDPKWSDLEFHLRNWWNYTWLGADGMVDQGIRQIDVMNWVMGGPPKSALAIGGRQIRGDGGRSTFDYAAIDYEYPEGRRATVLFRQIDRTYLRITEQVVGTDGMASLKGRIRGKVTWDFEGDEGYPYELEMRDLIDSIRAGNPINECRSYAESTLTAIMGRISAYTGQIVSWSQILKSKLDLVPKEWDFAKPCPVETMPLAGQQPLI